MSSSVNSNLNQWLAGSNTTTANTHLSNIANALNSTTVINGSSASVTSGAAVLLIAASADYKRRDVDIRPQGGDIYIASGGSVSSSLGKLVKDGEVCTLENFTSTLYAIASGATVTVRYDYVQRP